MDATPPPSRLPVSPAQVPPADVPGLNSLLTLAAGVVTIAALYLGREVLIPITLAVMLSFVLAPLVGLMRMAYLPRVPSALLAVVVALGVVFALGTVIAGQVAGLATNLPSYQQTVERKVAAVRGTIAGNMTRIMGDIGSGLSGKESTPQPGTRAARPAPNAPMQVEVHTPDPTPVELAKSVLAPVVGPLETTLIVFIVAVFVLLQKEDLRDRLIRLMGSNDLHRTTAAMDEAASRLSRYFLTQLCINAGFGVVIAVALYFIGLPSPLLWGILGALLRFVPYIGTILAAALPLLLAAAVDPGWSMLLWVAALFVIMEPLVGQVVEPLVYGHSTGLSPVSVVIAAIFWTWLWGPIGLIMSTPLTLCLVVLGRHVQRLEFLDVLLGDRPALTPIESFYQRMLAGDPEEAQDQAELLLKDRSLSSYYDEVAMKGLQLAAADARRGVLTDLQLEGIREAMGELVEDLGGHADAQPAPSGRATPLNTPSLAEQAVPRVPPAVQPADDLPPAWQQAGAVLCVAGRGLLDEVVAEMLVQLLGKHGLGARLVRHEEVSRSGIGNFEPGPACMACVVYLELNGAPSHLRHLVRRLRGRVGSIPILAGLWVEDDAVLEDAQAQAAIGADVLVTSLKDAVQACLDEVHPPETQAVA